MTTRTENERLAVLETKVEMLSADVTEVKSDVKGLIVAVGEISSHLAAQDASEEARGAANGAVGVWFRSAVPWLIAGAALLMSGVNTLFRLGS